MGIGSSDGKYYEDELSFNLDSVAPGRPRVYITGSTPEDEGTTPPTMPLGGSTEPAGALFSEGGTQTPENTSREEIRPTPDYMNPPDVPWRTPAGRPRMSEIVKGLVTGIAEGIEYFGGKKPTWAMDPTTGEVRTDPMAIAKVANAAELATFGPGVIAGRAAEGTLGSFIGAKAKSWDKNNYALANIMEKQGKSSDEILLKTGMFRGVDKKWRTEISDKDAVVTNDTMVRTGDGQFMSDLESFYQHPELYKNYPELKKIQVVEDWHWDGIAEAGPDYIRYNPAKMKEAGYDLKSIVIHEVQHLIQAKEGFAKGGGYVKLDEGLYKLRHQLNENQMQFLRDGINELIGRHTAGQTLSDADIAALGKMGKILEVQTKYLEAADKQALENYRRLAGEVESRNAETRQDLTKQELRLYPPEGSMDTFAKDQIVIDKPPAMSAYGFLMQDGTSRPIRPQMAEIKALRRAANDNPTPAQQEEARKLRKALRRQESDEAFAELQKLQRELDAKIAARPKPERLDEIRKELSDLHDILEKRDWTEIELKKYNKLNRERYGDDWEDMPFKMDE